MDLGAILGTGGFALAIFGSVAEILRRLKNRIRMVEGQVAGLQQYNQNFLQKDPSGQVPILRETNLKIQQLEKDGKLLENQNRITDSLSQVSRSLDRISDNVRDLRDQK